MKRLPKDFELDRYGLHVRLAQVEDSLFILSLRTDEKLSRFIHATDNDLEKQIAWMREYKKREQAGSDYYFVYEQDGKAIGVNRIYNIDYEKGICTGGSWICAPGVNFESSVATMLLERDIIFEFLEAKVDAFDVRKENKQVLKLHTRVGAEIVGETDIDYLFLLQKEIYEKKKLHMLKLLNLV